MKPSWMTSCRPSLRHENGSGGGRPSMILASKSLRAASRFRFSSALRSAAVSSRGAGSSASRTSSGCGRGTGGFSKMVARPLSTASIGTPMAARWQADWRRAILSSAGFKNWRNSNESSSNNASAWARGSRCSLVQCLIAVCSEGRRRSVWKSASAASCARTASTSRTLASSASRSRDDRVSDDEDAGPFFLAAAASESSRPSDHEPASVGGV
mmetsp:Transcript_26255/g.105045  ORF Transcript_26255/g.105045 Transcript_26255/m.105045 type:complete len:213 (+) Transcript_26255:1231-1869(+)